MIYHPPYSPAARVTNAQFVKSYYELLRVLDKHAPLKEIRVSDRKRQVWYDDHIKEQLKVKRNREFIWNKYGRKEKHHWKAFTIERSHYNRMIAGAKIRENSAKIEMCGHDTKKLYNLVNNMTGRTKSNPMPPGRKDTELADKFADFFLDKIRRICDDLADYRTYTPIEIEVEPLENFNPLSVGEVLSIIRSMPTKSCESDVLPTSLLKRSLDRLGKTITAIVNISLQEGIFADKRLLLCARF